MGQKWESRDLLCGSPGVGGRFALCFLARVPSGVPCAGRVFWPLDADFLAWVWLGWYNLTVGPAWICTTYPLGSARDWCGPGTLVGEYTVSQERTEAVVLRGVDFSESSRIVTFLSPDRGRLACMAKGVKRPKSKFLGLLDTFNRLELVYYWKDGRSVQQLGDASLLDGFNAIKRDLDKVTYGAFPLELAYKVAHENEPSEQFYATLVHGLESLAAWDEDVRTHCSWQVLGLVSAAGFAPGLETCTECGGPVPDAPRFSFDTGVRCGSCPSDRGLTAVEFNTLQALAATRDRCPILDSGSDVLDLLRRFAVRQLDSDFRSMRVIEQVFG